MNSIIKTEVAANAVFDVGERLDDALEQAKLETARWEGSQQQLARCSKQMEIILSEVDKEVESGKLDLEQAGIIKTWMGRLINIPEVMSQNASNLVLVAKGRIEGCEKAIQLVKATYDMHMTKLNAMQNAIAIEDNHGNVVPLVEDGKPPPLKIRRLSEASKEKKSKKKPPSE